MSISKRKDEHLDLCTDGAVGFAAKTTLLEQVELLHNALPELDADAIDPSVSLFGKQLRLPLIIAAMTGGTARAKAINQQLARIAEQRGLGFGLGSQRPMLDDFHDSSYRLRELAPSCLLLGNLGGVQARAIGTKRLAELAMAVGADAMCVHLNPAMEIIQSGGDRDFRGVLTALGQAAADLPVALIAKETGCGMSGAVARRLASVGVRHVDVSGAGGTSWVAVETERADTAPARSLGEALREWGVPTAASVAQVRAVDEIETVIATGGIQSGFDVARALALGANVAGMARPILQALMRSGPRGVMHLLDRVEAELRAVMLLCGAATVEELRRSPRMLGETLQRWIAAGSSSTGGAAV